MGNGPWARSRTDSSPHSISQPAGYHETAEKSTLVSSTSASNRLLRPRDGDGKRLRSVKKLKPSSKHEDRVSGKTMISKAKLTQSSAEVAEYSQVASQAEEEDNRSVCQSVRQEELQYSCPETGGTKHKVLCPPTLNSTAAQCGVLSLTPMARGKHQKTLPLIAGRQNTSVSAVSNSGTQQVGKLHKLLAVNPTSFSQTRPVRNLMMRAYDERRKGTSVATDQFIWSEVFPVLRPMESRVKITRRERRGRVLSYPTTSDDATPLLPKLVPHFGREDQQSVLVEAVSGKGNTYSVQTLHELKLPRIN